MELDNKKGKGVLGIVIIIILLGITCYLVYDKFVIQSDKQEKIDIYKSKISNLESELSNIKNTEDLTASNTIDSLIGSWSYEEVLKEGENNCIATIKLELKDDGTYTYESGHTCAGGREARGHWSINKDKIYLQNELCLPTPDAISSSCVYPNCDSEIELYYAEGQISAKRIGGILVNLIKK